MLSDSVAEATRIASMEMRQNEAGKEEGDDAKDN
jgi:hypothetical protein